MSVVFGLPGVHNLAIWRALSRSPIRLVGVRHEQTAVYAADGYARASGRLGVALVTTGPGAANTLGATGEAMASGSPVLVIATDIPSTLRRPGVYRGVLHETRDQTAMFGPVTKSARLVQSAGEIGPAVLDGAAVAQAAPSGPVYLGVPTDLLSAATPALPATGVPAAAGPGVDAAALEHAVRLLDASRRPLIWAGGGALRAGAGEAIGDLAQSLTAPVVTTYMGARPAGARASVHGPGPDPRAPGRRALGRGRRRAGRRQDFDAMMTQQWRMPAPPTLISVNVDAADANKNYAADVTLTGDARAVAEQLALARRAARRLDGLRARMSEVGVRCGAVVEDDDPQAARLPGDHGPRAARRLRRRRGHVHPGVLARRLPPRAAAAQARLSDGMGHARIRLPGVDRRRLAGVGPTVCVAGDGGFLFACGELATVAETGAPLTLIIVDDGGYGMLRFDQEQAGEEPFGVDLVRPDFAALTRSFGIEAATVDRFGQSFEAALVEAVAAAQPRVIVVNARLKPPPNTSPRWYRRE